ncbi:MAG: TIGR01212 family radical SAM protein [Clostridia bacterium]|nr:TIGR01212 family radical SAM protein [Clostridia bacterium]
MKHEIINNKRYNTQDNYLKAKFGCKIAKISLNGGFTCPNRDGTKGIGGCIYCSEFGSGDFAGDPRKSIHCQFNDVRREMDKKWKDAKYMPYFQAGTNTYAPLSVLREKFEAALDLENVIGLSIATRPDCIEKDTLEYLSELSKRTYLTVELGLQTSHDKTGELINRCCSYAEFLDCYNRLSDRGINTCIHLINGLPGEDREMMLESVSKVSALRPHSVKLHMLHIIKGTVCERMYNEGKFKCFTLEDYVNLVCDELELLPWETVIQRITGDGARDSLVAPLWSIKKFDVINGVDREMNRRNSFQGDKFPG